MDLDPYILTCRYLLSTDSFRSICIKGHPLALVLLILPFTQICYLFTYMVCFGTMRNHLLLTCLNYLHKTRRRILWNLRCFVFYKYFSAYAGIQIALQVAPAAFGGFLLALMAFGLLIGIMCNFVTLKMQMLIPAPFYYVFPTLSILVVVIIRVMLPMMISVYEVAKELHFGWERSLGVARNVTYLRRKVRSIRTVRLEGELFHFKFYKLQRSTMPLFSAALVNYTITALLSFDTGNVVS